MPDNFTHPGMHGRVLTGKNLIEFLNVKTPTIIGYYRFILYKKERKFWMKIYI
jgi:hypothetical protein